MSNFGIFNVGPYQKSCFFFWGAQIWILLTFYKILQRAYLIFNYALSFWYHYALPFLGALCHYASAEYQIWSVP